MLKRAKSFLGKTKTKQEFDLSESSHLRRHTTITNEVIKEQQVYREREKRENQSTIRENYRKSEKQNWRDSFTDNQTADTKTLKETYRKSVDGSKHNVQSTFLEEMKKKLLQKERKVKPPENYQINDWQPHPERRVQRSKSTLDRPNAANRRIYEISDREHHF